MLRFEQLHHLISNPNFSSRICVNLHVLARRIVVPSGASSLDVLGRRVSHMALVVGCACNETGEAQKPGKGNLKELH
jgi:hypothetical protein